MNRIAYFLYSYIFELRKKIYVNIDKNSNLPRDSDLNQNEIESF